MTESEREREKGNESDVEFMRQPMHSVGRDVEKTKGHA